ncbi:tumor necrosis factor receptor superfamily member 6B-like [Pholidichthys leucotaenia]
MLLPLLLPLALLAGLAHGASSPATTFDKRDPRTGQTVKCDRCPPGSFLLSGCTSAQKSECARCPEGSFTELWNHVPKCLRCGVCARNEVVKTPCSAESDCKCECRPGYYFRSSYGMCVQHAECPSGYGVLRKGTPHEDTVCQLCSNDTFSDFSSAIHTCLAHKSCGVSMQQVLKGSNWHDSVCADWKNCQDGGEYLREILPSFFTHQNINLKRLRRLVHRLTKERTSELSVPQLNVHLKAWTSSATAKQIQELPEILMKIGASGSGEKIKTKLDRISDHLKENCELGNEVDGK